MSNEALKPGSTIGIFGGGQLGRMLALSAAPLGLKSHIYCPETEAPAFDVSAAHTCAAYDDEQALTTFAKSCDAVTFEFENIPTTALEIIHEHTRLAPGKMSLKKTQDRLTEKTMLQSIDVPVAGFDRVDDLESLEKAVDHLGCPSILKTRRFGYDGKGQTKIDTDTDLKEAWDAIGNTPAVLEAFVPFQSEISVILTRGLDGGVVVYDLAENIHENHILRETRIPANVPQSLGADARVLATKIADTLDHIGTLAVECFYMGASADTPLIVNEIAPRVHNSGHWTIDGCNVSQFENHMRAVAGWPLGSSTRHSDAVMTNLLGEEADNWRSYATKPCAIHLYGKEEAKPGRKMGHITTISKKTGN